MVENDRFSMCLHGEIIRLDFSSGWRAVEMNRAVSRNTVDEIAYSHDANDCSQNKGQSQFAKRRVEDH